MTDMGFTKKIKAGLMATILPAGAIVVGGCADESFHVDDSSADEGAQREVTLALSTLRSGTQGTDGTPSEPATDAEKINSWWIAFVDSKGTVRRIINREVTGAVEMETFKCIVPAGVYTLYAFANITPAELKAASGVEFTVGNAVALPSGIDVIDDAVWNVGLNGWDASTPIPMSGFLKNVRVKNLSEERFSIEVVRMAAKMELVFSNIDDKAITVNGVSVDPVTTSAISLFPKGEDGISYAHLGAYAFSPREDAVYEPQVFSLPSEGIQIGNDENKSLTVYLQESLSERANRQAFTIGINVSHEDGVAEYQQYAITRDILSYINRNDHILIPVTLSRYYMEVEAVFYPPIGGYPAVASAVDPEGAQIFTFSSGGDFAIVPHVMDKQTGRHVAPHYYDVTLGDLTDTQGICGASGLTVTTGSSALPREVTGTLSSSKGRASVPLTVTVYDKPKYETGAKATHSYTRTIYLIRD